MVFCNNISKEAIDELLSVTILILIDGFLQFQQSVYLVIQGKVTILILIDGFLQYINNNVEVIAKKKSQSLF